MRKFSRRADHKLEAGAGLRVRRARAADSGAMLALERATSTAAHWSPQAYTDLFANPTSGSENVCASARIAWVAEDDRAHPDNPCHVSGFLVARTIDTDCELENIVVEEKIRRKGVGKLLLSAMIAYAKAAKAEIILEVRESNQAACAFYEKFGFENVGSRKKYYCDPIENAILYRLKLHEIR